MTLAEFVNDSIDELRDFYATWLILGSEDRKRFPQEQGKQRWEDTFELYRAQLVKEIAMEEYND